MAFQTDFYLFIFFIFFCWNYEAIHCTLLKHMKSFCQPETTLLALNTSLLLFQSRPENPQFVGMGIDPG